MGKPFAPILWFLAVAVLACSGFTGCVGPEPSPPPLPYQAEDFPLDLRRIPLSPQLGGVIRQLDRSWSEAEPATAGFLSRLDSLELCIQRPASRGPAGDELYRIWQGDPADLFVITLAIRYEYLLHRGAELEAMLARPELSDTTTVAYNFAEGCRNYGHGSRGEEFLRAENLADRRPPAQMVLLAIKQAMAESDQGHFLPAVQRLLDQAVAARQVGGSYLGCLLWYSITRHLIRADRLDDAVHAAAMSLALARRCSSRQWIGNTWILTATLLDARRESRTALALLTDTVRLGRDEDLPWVFLDAANKAASLCGSLSEPGRALEFDRMNLAYSLGLQDSLNTPRNMMNMAHDFRLLGQLDSCRVYHARARRWVEAYPNPRNRAGLPMFEAEFHCQVGDYAVAESLLAVAMERSPGASLAVDEARLLLGLIRQGLEMGQPDVAYRAIGRLKELRGVLSDENPDQNLVADYEIATADFLAGQGQHRLAREALDRARSAVQAAGGEGKLWEYHRSAGELALMREDLQATIGEFARCLELAAQSGNPDQLGTSRFHMGHALLAAGRYDEARALFADPPADDAFGERFRSRLSRLVFLGISYSLEGRPDLALDPLQEAERLLTPHSPSDLAARLECELGRALIAGGDVESGHAYLQRARRRLTEPGDRMLTAELRGFTEQTLREVTESLIALYRDRPGLAAAEDPAAFTLQLAETSRWSATGIRLPGGEPSLPRPIAVPAGHCLAAYFVGDRHSYLWTAVAGTVRLHELPGREELRSLALPFLADARQPGRTPAADAGLQLARTLLGPVLPVWRKEATLFLVPDDLLFELPWSALPLPDRDEDSGRVIDHGAIVEIPDLSALSPTAPRRTPAPFGERDLLALGVDSPASTLQSGRPLSALRLAEHETEQIAALWPAERRVLLTGSEATWEQALAAGLETAGVVHVASHAVVHQGLPSRASLHLAVAGGDAPLTPSDLQGLRLGADLVFLSCCEVAQHHGAGVGLMDFARRFLAAGARSVLASSVRIDDEVGLELAVGFYRHWREGMSKAAALRAAQLDLQEARPEWRHPYFWSFYRLVGDDR